MIKRVCLVAALAVMAVASAPVGMAASDVRTGKGIAQTWCSSCHAVGRVARPGDTAPSFGQLADSILLSESYLDAWLKDPRPPMHKFELTADMVSNLVSYLRSLKK